MTKQPVYHQGEIVYIPPKEGVSKNVKDEKIGDKRILFVASKIPSNSNLTFVYARDITGIDLFREKISDFFVLINIIAFVLMGGCFGFF